MGRSASIALLALVLALSLAEIVHANIPHGKGYRQRQWDKARTGVNNYETTLKPSNVNAKSFGRVKQFKLDDPEEQVYATPLYASWLNIPGKGRTNVVYIATESNNVYAFVADASNPNLSWGKRLWKRSFGDPVPLTKLPEWCFDIKPAYGITSTPTMDDAQTVLYVTANLWTKTSPRRNIYKVFKLDLITGRQLASSEVRATFTKSNGQKFTFVAADHLNRAANVYSNALLGNSNGKPIVVVTFGSHCDHGDYHGWVISFYASNLAPTGRSFISTASHVPKNDPEAGGGGGIWMAGAAPALRKGHFYFTTGDGWFNPKTGNYGNGVVKLDSNLKLVAYFAPGNQNYLNEEGADFGSTGPVIAEDAPGGPVTFVIGKDPVLYILDVTKLGKFSPTNSGVKQVLDLRGKIGATFGALAYWSQPKQYGGKKYAYMHAAGRATNHGGAALPSYLMRFSVDSKGKWKLDNISGATKTTISFPGATPVITTNKGKDALVWLQNNKQTLSWPLLFCYDAKTMKMLYRSDTNPKDLPPGQGNKFNIPLVVNGRVFVAHTGGVAVYGLRN